MKINLIALASKIPYHIMFIKRGNTASKSKYIKFDIKTCLSLERKNVSINHVRVMHELLNVFHERCKRSYLSYSIFRIRHYVTKGWVPFQSSKCLGSWLWVFANCPGFKLLNLSKWAKISRKAIKQLVSSSGLLASIYIDVNWN